MNYLLFNIFYLISMKFHENISFLIFYQFLVLLSYHYDDIYDEYS